MNTVIADELALINHVGDGSKFLDVSNFLDGGDLVEVHELKVGLGLLGLGLLGLPCTDHLFELVSSDSLREQFLGLVHFLHFVKFLESAQELELGLGLVRAVALLESGEASIGCDVASDVGHVEDLGVAGHGHGGSDGLGWAKVDDVAGLLEVGSLGSGGGRCESESGFHVEKKEEF